MFIFGIRDAPGDPAHLRISAASPAHPYFEVFPVPHRAHFPLEGPSLTASSLSNHLGQKCFSVGNSARADLSRGFQAIWCSADGLVATLRTRV